MNNEYSIIQQCINHYSCYVKHLIIGLCEEFQTNKVHSRFLTSVLERIFTKENNIFLTFFKDEKQSVPTQFIHYLAQQGEIIHVGYGYYTLPPERTVQLPDGQYVAISSLNEPNPGGLGIGRSISQPLSVSLTHDEYIYRPTFDTLLSVYTSKLTNHHDIEPDEMIFFSEKGSFKTSTIKNMQEDELYILYFDRVIGSNIKPEKYLAQWKNEEWYVTQIANSMFVRLRLALRFRKNVTSKYELIRHKNGYIEIKLNFLIPKEENILLRLIATPNESKWPKSYLTTENQIHNVHAILANCKLTEEGVLIDGIHN
ncbi:hypothetical protein EYB33_12005 [Lysinibacillus sphaericus]|uniref:hypothetical protein n=1 Tax=Lysinibacillus TaxID=400634 RepID=UPI00084B3C91|nr:hypothetical protein [Lysinibacillus sphaericus]OEC01301.1 hypothetical protein GY31_13480 [Lysinibacillus sphaericus]UDK96983.1 hypothetical protein EYB33_12005 [Lysinibacillus sphaericus]